MTPVFILCECNWDIPGLDRLPPHLHYTAGKATMPDGTEKWLAGALGVNDEPLEQREFIHLDVRCDRNQLAKFVQSVREGTE